MQMKRLFLILSLVALVIGAPAQSKKSSTKKATVTNTQRRKTTKKKSSRKSSSKRSSSQKRRSSSKKQSDYGNKQIKNLQSQRSRLQSNIRKQERALQANRADVKKRLKDLLVINSQIDESKKNIDGIEKDIKHIDGNLDILQSQISTLEKQLADRKAKYARSLRRMTRHHSFQDKLMFIFSADNFAQMFRRARFLQEYASYQRAQGELIKAKQQQVNEKHQQLQNVKGQKNSLLAKGQAEQQKLEGQKTEQDKVVKSLQRQQRSIQGILNKQRKEQSALNEQIDRMIAEEVAKARARAAAEAKRKAEAEAAARRRAAALKAAREKAEAEERANRERIAAARALEAKKKAAAAEAAKQDNEAAEERAKQEAREAEAARVAAERKAEAERSRNKKAIAKAEKSVKEAETMSAADRLVSGGFEANRGRLPMPITGSYRVVTHYGQYNVEGLKGVRLDNKGINILGKPGCRARAVYDGVVSRVFSFGGQMVVMVRHGAYISVYCNLSSVSVATGQKVSTRQALGTVGSDNILQFQLHRETTTLNPESWISR